MEKTRSSIFNIILTHSVAKVSALVVTRLGCKTFSSVISLLTKLFLILMPAFLKPLACLFLSSVTTLIGLNPAFSARV